MGNKHTVPDHRIARDTFIPARIPDGAIKPDIAAHPGIALVRTDERLGRAHMPGLAKQHQRGDKNAERINLSPPLCEPLGSAF